MQWIDMHCDTLSELHRQNLQKSIQGTDPAQDSGSRTAGCRGTMQTLEKNSLCVDISRLEQAECRAQFFACFVNAAEYAGENGSDAGSPARQDHTRQDLSLWDRAYEAVLQMSDLAREAQNDRFRLAVRRTEFEGKEEKKEKEEKEAKDEAQHERNAVKGILTVEEGGVLGGRPARLEELYQRGVRLITLTWNYENCLGSPNSRDPAIMSRGLTPFGFETVERMNGLGMLIDVSHLSDGGFWDCIRMSRAPVIASHSNARALCPHPRNLSDEMLAALGEKGGVVGVNFYGAFLRAPDEQKTRRGNMTGTIPGIDDILRHMRHIMDKAGEDAVALGTDFDGFDRTSLPRGIAGVQDMEKIWEAMEQAGFTARQIEKTAYGNVSRIIRDVWK